MGLSRDADVLRSSECGDSEKAGGIGRGAKPNQTKPNQTPSRHRYPHPNSPGPVFLHLSLFSMVHDQR